MDYGVVFCITTPQICCNCGRTLFDFYLNSANKSALKPLKISPIIHLVLNSSYPLCQSSRNLFSEMSFLSFPRLALLGNITCAPSPSPTPDKTRVIFICWHMWCTLRLRSYFGFCILSFRMIRCSILHFTPPGGPSIQSNPVYLFDVLFEGKLIPNSKWKGVSISWKWSKTLLAVFLTQTSWKAKDPPLWTPA